MSICGIKNGMVMQRGEDNACDIRLTADRPLQQVTCSGDNAPCLTKDGDGYRLTGIYVGGPYTVEIDGERFDDIYVGDVWILAGQSNMQGVGRIDSAAHNDNPAIRALYMTDEWGIANHPLHELGRAKHKVHTEVLGSRGRKSPGIGAGPGLAFAKKMFELMSVPQGLICCAHGGTSLAQWSPDLKSLGGDKSLYAAMLERYFANGGNARGMFWYQGCSDAEPGVYEAFTDNMIKFVSAFRADFGKELPMVQVQIARLAWHNPDEKDKHICWASIREQQRLLAQHIDRLDTVAAVAYRLEDCIHLSGAAQDNLGEAAAESMYCLLFGEGNGCLPGIQLRDIRCRADELDPGKTRIILRFDNVHGGLHASGRVMGFDQSWDAAYPAFGGIYDAYADGNRIVLKAEMTVEEARERYFWYGHGVNPACNVVDAKGRSVPAFGPVQIG